MIPMRTTLAAACLLAAVFVQGASFESAHEVAQPIHTEDHIFIGRTTYTVHTTDKSGTEVSLTCRENQINTQVGFENRNLASLAGIEVKVMRNTREHSNRFGDSLRVVLDLSVLEGEDEFMGHPVGLLAEVTFECLMINARQDDGIIRFLDLRVEGPRTYKKYEGCHDLAKYDLLPKKQIYR
jgi:hypothetical protein